MTLLAEALNLRADAQKRLAQIQHRIENAARFQEGEEPQEDAMTLIRESEEIVNEIEWLVRAINRTNNAATIVLESRETLTLADAIAKKDALHRRRGVLTSAAEAARPSSWGRSTRTELRWVTNLPVAELRNEADKLAKEARELDLRLQQANWTTDIVP